MLHLKPYVEMVRAEGRSILMRSSFFPVAGELTASFPRSTGSFGGHSFTIARSGENSAHSVSPAVVRKNGAWGPCLAAIICPEGS